VGLSELRGWIKGVVPNCFLNSCDGNCAVISTGHCCSQYGCLQDKGLGCWTSHYGQVFYRLHTCENANGCLQDKGLGCWTSHYGQAFYRLHTCENANGQPALGYTLGGGAPMALF
jgi:hypothetical protein